MPRQRVDAYRILEQLRAGMSGPEIAKEEGVSRQAIDLWRQKFIREGFLEKANPGRTKSISRTTTEFPTLLQIVPTLSEIKESLQHILNIETSIEDIKKRLNALEGQQHAAQPRKRKKKISGEDT